MSHNFKAELTRRTALGTLAAFAAGLALAGCSRSGDAGTAVTAANIDGPPEKPQLKLGFIKLTD
ncbi:MAG: hypothetical protein KDE15_11790, partial [Erythrobacter sp.]|nr:hypothetical protein [Erythrobacter sp.]